MNFREQLLVAHSRANADLVLHYVLEDRTRLPELITEFFGNEVKVVQRAAMVVGDLGRLKPTWLVGYHGKLVAAAAAPLHPAVRRAIMRYFSELPLELIGEETEGPLVDLAFRLTEDPAEPVAIRVSTMQIVYNFCARYPELKQELREAIEGELREGSPGFRSRGIKILKQLGE